LTGAAHVAGSEARTDGARADTGGVIAVADAAFRIRRARETGLDARRPDGSIRWRRVTVLVAARDGRNENEYAENVQGPSGLAHLTTLLQIADPELECRRTSSRSPASLHVCRVTYCSMPRQNPFWQVMPTSSPQQSAVTVHV
jgi:hypothetical protein